MINVGSVVSDSRLAQSFIIQRSSGQFALGGWQSTTTNIPAYGCIQVADQETLEQMPDADRVTGSMVFYSQQPIYRTRGGAGSGLSDVLIWRGQSYRVSQVFSFEDYGYYRAVAVRMSGE